MLKPEEKEFLLLETSVMKILDHPHVIKLHDTIETKDIIYIITELVRDGDLFDYIMRSDFLEEMEASIIMKQLLNTFSYLHETGVIHRDIKPENILISKDESDHVKSIKIIDFGFAKFITEGTLLTETCGTPNYVAPEVLKGTGYGKKADIWSLGILMYLMLRGQLPFDSLEVDQILKNTLRLEFNFDDYHWRNISPEGKDLLQKFLQRDQSKRIDLASALNHPWIRKAGEILPKYKGANRLKKEK